MLQNEVVIFISIGLIAGLELSLLYIPTWIAANTYYNKWRQLANAIVVSGSSVGLVVFPPFVHWLLESYGLQGTFMILGACSLNTVILGALIPQLMRNSNIIQEDQYLLKSKENIEDVEITDTKQKILDWDKRDVKGLLKYVKFKLIDDFIALDLFKNWEYSAFVISMCLLDPVALHTIYTYLPDFIIHVGYSSDVSWIPLTVLGITNTVARLTMGVSNKSVSTITVIFGLGALLNGLSVLFMPFISDHFWLICLSAGIFGFGKGVFWSLRGPVLMEIVPS